MKKPNILFLFADDMRYDTIAEIGDPQVITPNLDELARSGTAFVNAHIPGGTIVAVCMPSRAMLNTGRNIFHLQESGKSIPEDHALIGETLQKAGYNTFGTGKWHNCKQSYARSFNHGDEIYFGGMYDHWNVPMSSFDPEGKYDHEINDIQDPGYGNFMYPKTADHVSMGVHSTELFADAACRFINDYDDEKPFYMYVAYMAPHDPRSMPQKYLDMYDADKILLPPNFAEKHPFDYGLKYVRDEILLPLPRDRKQVKENIRDYFAMITHLDDTVGKIIQTLKDSGRYEDTIIIFFFFFGLSVGQHGLLGKQSCYEHSIRVPFIMSGPGIEKNARRNGYIYLMDLFPTLCDMLGINKPEGLDGISFEKMIHDSEYKSRQVLFSIYGDKVRSIKDGKYKLIEYKCRDLRKTQLFDLENDPWEKFDLSGREDLYPKVLELRNLMRRTAEEWGDLESSEGKRFWFEYMKVEDDVSGFGQG